MRTPFFALLVYRIAAGRPAFFRGSECANNGQHRNYKKEKVGPEINHFARQPKFYRKNWFVLTIVGALVWSWPQIGLLGFGAILHVFITAVAVQRRATIERLDVGLALQVFWLLGLLLTASSFLMASTVETGAAGMWVFALGCYLMWQSQAFLGSAYYPEPAIVKGHTFIVNGPFKLVRHPFYTSWALVSAGLGIYFQVYKDPCASGLFLVGQVLYLIAARKRGTMEETLLSENLGIDLCWYRSLTPMMLPTPRSLLAYLAQDWLPFNRPRPRISETNS